ncbi:MAG: histidine kinase, partial [Lewinellaceae bacterium]|nr:histidine kinase [Lewinellaceae bacterium]
NSIHGTSIALLAEDHQGRIWIGHNNGLDVYSPRTGLFSQVPLPADPDNNQPWSFPAPGGIYVSSQDQILLANNSYRLLLIDGKTFASEWLKPSPVSASLIPKQVNPAIPNILTGIGGASDTSVWISSFQGLFELNLSNKVFTFHPLVDAALQFGPSFPYIDTIRRQVWFNCFDTGLFSYNPQKKSWKRWDQVPAFEILEGGQGITGRNAAEIWLPGGGYLNPATGNYHMVEHIPDDASSFSGGSILVAYTDQDGIIWWGTTRGLCKLDPRLQGFHHTLVSAHPRYTYDNSIYEIYTEPADGQLYITSFYLEGIYTFNPRTGQSQAIPSAADRPLVGSTRIFRDSRGITWLLTRDVVYHVDLPRKKFIPVPLPPLPPGADARNFIDIEEDATGDIWLSRWKAGLLHWERKTGRFSYLPISQQGLSTRQVWDLTMSRDRQTLWVATHAGLIFRYHLPTRTWSKYSEFRQGDRNFPLKEINGLAVDRQDRLWIGAQNGICCYAPNGSVQVFGEAQGLANSQLAGMQMDSHDRLWIASTAGITCLETATGFIRNFDEHHGLKTDAGLDYFSFGPDGRVFSGTKQGFISFHPDSLPRDTKAPQLVITGFQVSGRDFLVDRRMPGYWDTVRLQPQENFFAIAYAALHPMLPREVHYAYQLKGFDQDWVDAGSRRLASYTRVPPGRYTFCLRAKTPGGEWSYLEVPLVIQVSHFFWQTPWFISIMTLLIGGLIWGIYQWRSQQIRRQEQMKAAFNKKLAEVEMAALRSQMNPHFLFNCLNSINRFIQRNEPDAASAYLTKFSRLIRLVLDNSRANVVSLRDEMEALRLYIELEAMRFVDRFQYTLTIDPGIDINSIEIPPLLIQPYVENAIWHGLMHKESNDGQLLVKVLTQQQRLHIVIQDNGIGRQAAVELKSKSATLHKSHGLQMTAQRIAIINEQFQARANVEIEDLADASGTAAGTKVTISLPLD